MMATVHPAARQRDATTDAPEPVPITTTSYCFSIHVTPVKVTPSGRSSGRLATWALSGGGGQPCDIGRLARRSIPECQGRWHAVEHLGGPPQAFQTALAAAFAPDNLPLQAYPILHGMSRLRFAALHLAASRSGGLPRRAGARTEECARGGRQRGALRAPGVCSRGARAKSRPVEFLPRPPGVCPWRAVSALCRRRGQPLPQALPQLAQLRCVHLHNTRRLAASAGCARRPLLGAGELGRPRSGARGDRVEGRTRWQGRSAPPHPRWLPGQRPTGWPAAGGGASGHALARPAPGGQRGAGERPQAWAQRAQRWRG